MDSIINLNVGGTVYTTSYLTLTKYPKSMLSRMFSGNIPSAQDEHGNFVIDRDGKLFRFILAYLRSSCSKLILPDDFNELEMLLEEAEFFQIPPLIEQIKELILMRKPKNIDDIQVFMLNVGGTVFHVHRKYLEPSEDTITELDDPNMVEFVKYAVWKKFQKRDKTLDRHLVMGNVWETVNKIDCPKDKDGNFYIDCNPNSFRSILSFIRSGQFGLPKDISDNEVYIIRDDLYKLNMHIITEYLPLDFKDYPCVKVPDFEFLWYVGICPPDDF